jgi:hypothetical protein
VTMDALDREVEAMKKREEDHLRIETCVQGCVGGVGGAWGGGCGCGAWVLVWCVLWIDNRPLCVGCSVGARLPVALPHARRTLCRRGNIVWPM